MRRALTILLLILSPSVLHAQWSDDFADGDFTHDPPWTGTTSRWEVLPIDGRLWLATAGMARSDTLTLATASAAVFGRWQFRFRFQDVNLSNFNGARVFLMADTDDLKGDVHGYFLQFGTNNSNEVRLFRIDGDPSRRRVEIGRSADPILAGTDGELAVEVRRDAPGVWRVHTDGELIIETFDSTYVRSTHFGVWVKHTAAAGASYYFADFEVDGVVPDEADPGDDPIPPPPPRLALSAQNDRTLMAEFSRAMSADVCDAGAFRIDDAPPIDAVVCESARTVRIELSEALAPGTYVLHIEKVRDAEGRLYESISGSVTIDASDSDDGEPVTPRRARIENVRYTWRHARDLVVELSDPADASRLADFDVSLDGTRPGDVHSEEGGRSLRLSFPYPIETGTRRLAVAPLYTVAGVVVDTTILVTVPAAPGRMDLVVNEIHYDPLDQTWEFFEILNRSDVAVDASWLDWSDDRHVRTPLSTHSYVLEPGSHTVFARSGDAFTDAFPDVPHVVPPTWHALNNPGDAVVVYAGAAVLDSVVFTSAWGGRHVSLERIDPDLPSVRANFGSSVDPSGATPGRRNSVFFQDPSRGTFTDAREIAPGHVAITPDRPLSPDASRATDLSCPPAAVDDVRVTDEIIHLTTSGGRPLRCSGSGIFDALMRPMEPFDLEIALLPEPGELVINEVMFDPLADPNDGLPDQPFYVELTSTSPHLLSLETVALSGAPTEIGDVAIVRHARPDARIAPGGFAVFSAEGAFEDDVGTKGLLAGAFSSFEESMHASVLLPVARSTLGIRRGGDLVRLIRADSTVLDEVFVHPSHHHPSLRVTRGRSLERRSINLPSGDPANWLSSTAEEGGTPGQLNSLALSPDDGAGRTGIRLEPRVVRPDDLADGNHLVVRYVLDAETATLRVRLFDSRGRLVRTLENGRFSGRHGELIWDGHGDDRQPLRVGIYIVHLEAVDVASGHVETYRETVVLGRKLR